MKKAPAVRQGIFLSFRVYGTRGPAEFLIYIAQCHSLSLRLSILGFCSADPLPPYTVPIFIVGGATMFSLERLSFPAETPGGGEVSEDTHDIIVASVLLQFPRRGAGLPREILGHKGLSTRATVARRQ